VGKGNSSPLYGETELRALHPFACRTKGWRRSEDRGAYDEEVRRIDRALEFAFFGGLVHVSFFFAKCGGKLATSG
jgi:hypothetical protein